MSISDNCRKVAGNKWSEKLKYCIFTDFGSFFQTPTAFPHLRQLVHNNNETLREIISIFDERAALDFAYAKTMQKLSSRLHKISTNTTGIVDRSWSYVADQFDAQASIHNNLGSAITDDIVQPLRAIFSSQQKTIRATEQLANRELRFLNAKRDELTRIKRLLHSSSRDLEKIEQLVDNDRTSNIKLSVKKRKLLEQVMKQEQAYIEETIAAERQRRVTDGVLRKGVEYLELVEKQRLAHCQTALGRFQMKIAQLGPNLNVMFERCMNALNDAVNAELDEQILLLIPSFSTKHTVYLCDFHAENFAEVIAGQRRRWTLERVAAIIEEYLQRAQVEVIPTSPSTNFANFGLVQTVLTIPLDEFEHAEKPSAPSFPTTSSVGDETEATTSELREPLEQYVVPRLLSYAESQNMQISLPSGISGETTSKQIYRVLYDFSATLEDELEVHAGDCVLVEGKIGNDWLIGQIISNNSSNNISKNISNGNSTCNSQMTSNGEIIARNNKVGRFPASYVAFTHDS
ncbi:unnamed protein product [Thelazia callipaeda]|uniref:SH3 domain-containing protein n=1 Tax=Thelazia callipaeda TaxID=103827 RepID=A0A0N5DA30_THECL|nr:unnamed protein product [Thelazia callipaeda]